MKQPSKRTLLIASASLILLFGAGVYTWQSLSSWKAYEARLKREQGEYQELKDDALSGKTADQRLAAIKQLDEKLQKRDELCAANLLFAWQANLIPALKDGVATCKSKVEQLDAIAGPLGTLRSTLEVSQKVEGILSSLVATESLTESNWAERGQGAAKKAQESLKAINASGESKQVIEQAKSLTAGLVKSWDTLIAANAAKDKTAFLAASSEVQKADADFGSLADSFDELITEQASKAIDSAKSL